MLEYVKSYAVIKWVIIILILSVLCRPDINELLLIYVFVSEQENFTVKANVNKL